MFVNYTDSLITRCQTSNGCRRLARAHAGQFVKNRVLSAILGSHRTCGARQPTHYSVHFYELSFVSRVRRINSYHLQVVLAALVHSPKRTRICLYRKISLNSLVKRSNCFTIIGDLIFYTFLFLYI